jgi:glutamine amidotransferase
VAPQIRSDLTMTKKIVLIDYGMGNLWSVKSALEYLGAEVRVSGDPEYIRQSESLILPGVGSFHNAIKTLRSSGLADAIVDCVVERKRKILGICLGMQLLGEYGSEDGHNKGLGLIKGDVNRLPSTGPNPIKVPHIGFNTVNAKEGSSLFRNLGTDVDFYFVHSYCFAIQERPGLSASCAYGTTFLAAYEHENVFATQFHPEKSQSNGLILLKNFLCE